MRRCCDPCSLPVFGARRNVLAGKFQQHSVVQVNLNLTKINLISNANVLGLSPFIFVKHLLFFIYILHSMVSWSCRKGFNFRLLKEMICFLMNRRFLQRPCDLLANNRTKLQMASANAEIGIGFMLIFMILT